MPNELDDLSGQVFGSWTVLSEHQTRMTPRGNVSEWLCQCTCGVIKWVPRISLFRGKHPQCYACYEASVLRYRVGAKVGEFEIVQKVGPSNTSKRRVRCVCGRERVFNYAALAAIHNQKSTRQTCGCNGIDQPYLRGDPNLPAGVETYCELIDWAGCSRQAHYAMIHRKGLRGALTHLAEIANHRHPGEGWRIVKVVPVPGEGWRIVKVVPVPGEVDHGV